jgi:peptidoglycan/LPS O-acetylase OafA/YrhL
MYYNQFNGIRALAVISVIIHHWTHSDFFLADVAHHGAIGVPLFFVLSGFLITTILITVKNTKEADSWTGIKLFYARRMLRIFPIYYFVILLLVLFVPVTISPHLIWLLCYQYNSEIFFHGWQLPSYIHHLWTLSIEEQFYLIWPIIMLCFSLKNSLRFIVLLILLSISCVGVLYLYNPLSPYSLFTLSSFPGLCMGSLLAFLRFRKITIPYRSYLFFLTLGGYLILHTSYINFYGKGLLSVISVSSVLLSTLLIDKTIDGFKGWFGVLLENRIVSFIGKISYGLYLYHMFIPDITAHFLNDLALSWYSMALINISLLASLALISWHLIEKPINDLKKHFNYTKTKEA